MGLSYTISTAPVKYIQARKQHTHTKITLLNTWATYCSTHNKEHRHDTDSGVGLIRHSHTIQVIEFIHSSQPMWSHFLFIAPQSLRCNHQAMQRHTPPKHPASPSEKAHTCESMAVSAVWNWFGTSRFSKYTKIHKNSKIKKFPGMWDNIKHNIKITTIKSQKRHPSRVHYVMIQFGLTPMFAVISHGWVQSPCYSAGAHLW